MDLRQEVAKRKKNWQKERMLEEDKNYLAQKYKDKMDPSELLDKLALRVSERVQSQLESNYQPKKMNAMAGSENKLTSEIMSNTCPICLELFLPPNNSPILLFPCGHTFCKRCLEILKKDSKKRCPFCRSQIQSQAVNISLQNLICIANNRKEDVVVESKPEEPQEEIDDENEYVNQKNMVELRINVLEQEKMESKKMMKDFELDIATEGQIIETLLYEESDAKMRLEKLKEELRLIEDHLNREQLKRENLEKEKRSLNEKINLLDSTLQSLYKEKERISFFLHK